MAGHLRGKTTPEERVWNAAYMKKWTEKNKDRINQKRREQHAADPEAAREKARRYRANRTPEQIEQAKASRRAWAERNREKVREYKRLDAAKRRTPEQDRERHLRSKFGLTTADWDALFASQGNKCAICSTDDPKSVKGWHTDHCHASGKVRGILCGHCNHILGRAFDKPAVLRSAATYLERG